MPNVTQILEQVERGDRGVADELLTRVYDELRKLATARLAREPVGQTLQATDLVHEAYLRLVDVRQAQQFKNRAHFFAAAAEAMRRILIDRAQCKKSRKHGGEAQRVDAAISQIAISQPCDELIALGEAIELLAKEDADAAQVVKLRYFAGLTVKETAEILEVSPRKADFMWSYARAWIRDKMSGHS